MKLSPVRNQTNFKGDIFNSKLFKKSLEFACDNSALFCAGASLAFSSIARPVAIMLTPKTDKENKKYAAAKSIASSITGFGLTYLITTPFADAIKNIDKKPDKFLSTNTIKNLQAGADNLQSSKNYKFMSQLFKLGLGLFIAIPKSSITSFLIPKVIKFLPKKESNEISFKGNLYNKGIDKLSGEIGDLMADKNLQRLSKKFSNTNYEQGLMYLTDLALTGAFIHKTKKNNKIEEERKKPLIYNSILSTAFSIISSFSVNKLIDKKYQGFVEKFKEVNKNSPKLDKYLTGLNIMKLSIIMGGIYYIGIPILSTFLADKIKSKNQD